VLIHKHEKNAADIQTQIEVLEEMSQAEDRPLGEGKGTIGSCAATGERGRAERVQRKHYLFERCFACKAVTAEE